MSARASARTLSARAWFSAVRDRCSQGASTIAQPGQGQHRHRHHLGQLLQLALLGDHDAEGRADQSEPDDHPDQSRPAAAGHERSQPRPAAGLGPPAFLVRAVGLAPDQRRPRTGERHRPEHLRADSQPTALGDPEQSGAERGEREQHPPVDPAARSPLVPHARPAGRLQAGRRAGRLRWQQQPECAVGQHADELGHQDHEDDPDDQHRPAEMASEPGTDPAEPGALGDAGGPLSAGRLLGSVLRRTRGRIGDRHPGGRSPPRTDAVEAWPTGTIDSWSGAGGWSRRSASVAVMMSLPSHAFRSATSRVAPELSPKGAIGGGP